MVSKVYYLNSDKYPVIVEDVQQVKTHVDKKQNEDFTCVFEALPQYRRLHSASNKFEKGQTASALGMASLALINLPEDCRDVKGAFNQIKSLFAGKKFEASYDYTKYQHPFSFFRGTMLKNFANPAKSSNPELAEKLFKIDKTIANTDFGKKILDLLNVKKVGRINTKINTIDSTKECQKFLRANVYEGNAFGKFTAHALERCPVLSLAVIAGLEIPQVIGAFSNGNGVFEKGENGSKQIVKSAINVASITAGIGYLGAIGSKFGGPAGSLIGMGAGAIIGGYGSKRLQEIIN